MSWQHLSLARNHHENCIFMLYNWSILALEHHKITSDVKFLFFSAHPKGVKPQNFVFDYTNGSQPCFWRTTSTARFPCFLNQTVIQIISLLQILQDLKWVRQMKETCKTCSSGGPPGSGSEPLDYTVYPICGSRHWEFSDQAMFYCLCFCCLFCFFVLFFWVHVNYSLCSLLLL